MSDDFKWGELIISKPKRGKLVSKVKMKKIVLDENNAIWAYDFVGNELWFSFYGYVAECPGPIILDKDVAFTNFKK